MGLRGMPLSLRGLRPRIRVSAFERSRWFIGRSVRSISPLATGRLRHVSGLPSIFYRQTDRQETADMLIGNDIGPGGVVKG